MKDQLYETPEVLIFLTTPKDLLTLSDNDAEWNSDAWDNDDDIFDGEIFE